MGGENRQYALLLLCGGPHGGQGRHGAHGTTAQDSIHLSGRAAPTAKDGDTQQNTGKQQVIYMTTQFVLSEWKIREVNAHGSRGQVLYKPM